MKKTIAMILIIILVIALLPTVAFAIDDYDGSGAMVIDTAPATSLQASVEAALTAEGSGHTTANITHLTMTSNVTYTLTGADLTYILGLGALTHLDVADTVSVDANGDGTLGDVVDHFFTSNNHIVNVVFSGVTFGKPETTPVSTVAALYTGNKNSNVSSTDQPAPTVQPRLQEYYDENSDLVGWIKIPNTTIDYPVVQTNDNDWYRKMSFDGESSAHGAIFLDYHCDITNLADGGVNLVVFGHNMKDGSMFENLMLYKDEDFFRSNPVIEFDTLYENLSWEIFSVYVASTSLNHIDTTFVTRQGFEKFLKTYKEKSLFTNVVTPNADDVVLTLSTCSYEFENARFVVQARLIQEQ